MEFTKEQLAQAKAAKSVEELLALARENGIELTEEAAKEKFEMFHAQGELADDELDNVSGGSSCVNGRHYSDDPPHYLITTAGNWCDYFEEREASSWRGSACERCIYRIGTVPMYCKRRTKDNDPCND